MAALTSPAFADPLSIDLTSKTAPATATPIEPGASTNPAGQTISADSRSLFLDRTPWIPVAGEFQYSRYPRAEWRDELLKMKAGGIETVSTYVFWIHHEEERGKFDWSGQRSLRDFLLLCQEVGLKALVRVGPWCHGEVRNGGFPDWVQRSGTKLRTTDPAFLALVEPLYAQIASQTHGLMWKDGGPVIGIQVDNECDGTDYLLALKKMARDAGIDVPLYTMTGWDRVAIPTAGLLPLFGAYPAGFWNGNPESYRKSFLFSDVRDDNDLGAQMQNVRPARNQHMEAFPYACVEIGPGMMSSYKNRIKIDPEDAAALAMNKLGCGNNMSGYYMYQGGVNPDGKFSYLQEDHPNALPVKDYDFQTALGTAGQVRAQFHLLNEQNLFLADFGAVIARMPAFFPERRPRDLKDFDTVRWSMRADEQGRGFLFIDNRQPLVPMPPKAGVQFALKSPDGVVTVPREPVTIGTGVYGFWPVGLDCGGMRLDYATVQPLCRVADEDGAATYFFVALAGVRPELAVAGKAPLVVVPGTGSALTTTSVAGATVRFVVLTPEQGRQFYRTQFAGRERAILSNAVVLADGPSLRLQADSTTGVELAMFPPVNAVNVDGAKVTAATDGVFARLSCRASGGAPVAAITATLETPAGANAASLTGTDEATWKDAAVYKLGLPENVPDGHRVLLDVHYIGDAARIYVGDYFFDDHFYNGDPIALPLWRIPRADWPKIRLKVLPYSDLLMSRLPENARRDAAAAKLAGTLDQIKVTASDQIEIKIVPLPSGAVRN